MRNEWYALVFAEEGGKSGGENRGGERTKRERRRKKQVASLVFLLSSLSSPLSSACNLLSKDIKSLLTATNRDTGLWHESLSFRRSLLWNIPDDGVKIEPILSAFK